VINSGELSQFDGSPLSINVDRAGAKSRLPILELAVYHREELAQGEGEKR
jgi:hypothetical protein